MRTRILLVDDDPDVRVVLRRALISAGHDVEETDDGRAALEAYAQRRPDVLLTDIVMPGCDGLELILEMRRLDPTAAIIAMSGGGTADNALYLTTATDFGAALVLRKPFTTEALLSAVTDVVTTHSARARTAGQA